MEKFLGLLIFVGGFLVLGGVGGIQTDAAGLVEGTMISLVGFFFIAVAILIANREGNF